MNRARNITDKDVASIVELLDGWTGRLTWDLLLDAIEKKLHARYTRQSLHNHARVKDGFTQRKATLSGQPVTTRKTVSSPELALALERIARLTAENLRLDAENGRLLEQFARWAYNASTRNLSAEFLNQPLPPVDRDPTRLTGKRRNPSVKG